MKDPFAGLSSDSTEPPYRLGVDSICQFGLAFGSIDIRIGGTVYDDFGAGNGLLQMSGVGDIKLRQVEDDRIKSLLPADLG
jgi:hypothetical protein